MPKTTGTTTTKEKTKMKEQTEDKILGRAVATLKVAPLQTYQNMTVAPLIGVTEEEGPEYLTLTEALAEDLLEVTEIDHGGSVPNLRVRNLSEGSVLLLDGEELMGAKQNRVLNTTVLVAGQTEVVVPVSCTEQGRWQYKSDKFMDSGVMMAKMVRSCKSQSVTQSLRTQSSYHSNQGAVWNSIAHLSNNTSCYSPTGAMKAVYEQSESVLICYREAFPRVEGQRGVLFFISGSFAGSEILSRTRAYAQVHDKILDSYALEALLDREPSHELPSSEQAEKFLSEVSSWRSERFKSVGLGDDLRFRNLESHGNALLVEDTVVHAAAFGPHREPSLET